MSQFDQLDPAILEAFLDELPIGAIVVDDDGIVRRFNRHEEQLSGLSRDEVLGESFFSEVAPCTDDIQLREKFERGLAAGDLDFELEFTFPYPYNRVARDVKIRAMTVEANDRHANFMLVDEITSQRELERTNEEVLSGLRKMIDGESPSTIGRDGDGGTISGDTGEPVAKKAVCLYADLSSFQNLADQVGPKELFNLLDGRIRQAVQILHRHGGTLDEISGDAVRGFFLIDEDQPHRPFYDALRSARDLVEAETKDGIDLPFRVGISNGSLLSGRLGREELSRSATVGHPVTVARQLAGLATPDDVVLTAEVVDRCSDVVRTTELPKMSISGLDDYWPLQRMERLELPRN